MSYTEGPTRTFASDGTAKNPYLRVILSAGVLALASASQRGLGTLENRVLAGDQSETVRLRTAQGTQKMVAAGAITAGATVYAAASGKVAASGTVEEGTALTAAGADGDVIEVLPNLPAASLTPVVTATANASLTEAQSGALVTNRGAAGTVTLSLPSAPAVGTTYRAAVGTAQALRLDPADADGIIIAGAAQANGKYVEADDEAESLVLTYIGSNKWLASNVVGTWTVEA